MARPIRSLPNTNPPDSDYQFGRLRDNPGDGTGTKVNEAMLGDMKQFFEKLMFDAGIAFNGLPDNSYSGYQLNQALGLFINGQNNAWNNLSLLNSWAPSVNSYARWRFIGPQNILVEIQAILVTPAGLNNVFANIPAAWNMGNSLGNDRSFPISSVRGSNFLNNFIFKLTGFLGTLRVIPANADAMTSGDVHFINQIFRVDTN